MYLVRENGNSHMIKLGEGDISLLSAVTESGGVVVLIDEVAADRVGFNAFESITKFSDIPETVPKALMCFTTKGSLTRYIADLNTLLKDMEDESCGKES